MELPWDLPLAEWTADACTFKRLDVGPSRHLVRFVESDGTLFALKEEPVEIARKEFEVLRHLEDKGLPAVAAVGLAEAAERDSAILVTEYLAHSLQYRRLLMRFPLGPGGYRDRLLDAMAWLLFDLHRGGVYWGDCSLANTLFRRDGDRIQAYLVDAETSEVHEPCRTASASTTWRSSWRTSRSASPTWPRSRDATRAPTTRSPPLTRSSSAIGCCGPS